MSEFKTAPAGKTVLLNKTIAGRLEITITQEPVREILTCTRYRAQLQNNTLLLLWEEKGLLPGLGVDTSLRAMRYTFYTAKSTAQPSVLPSLLQWSSVVFRMQLAGSAKAIPSLLASHPNTQPVIWSPLLTQNLLAFAQNGMSSHDQAFTYAANSAWNTLPGGPFHFIQLIPMSPSQMGQLISPPLEYISWPSSQFKMSLLWSSGVLKVSF